VSDFLSFSKIMMIHPLSPDQRREPVDKRKRLAPITPEFTVFAELEESQVDPGDKESELNDDVWILSQEDGEDVGYQKVNSGQVLTERESANSRR
jgi:hypothetical protein